MVSKNESIKNNFELRKFKSSKDKDFIEALKIYNRNIPKSIRTDSNEITYWLDHYNKKFADKKLYVFGLYFNDIIVGFSEMVYLQQTKIFVIDYLVIEPSFRKNNLFNAFALSIEQFVESEQLQYDFVLTEIGFMNNDKDPSHESRVLIRLLKTGGFDVIRAPYKQPQLGMKNYESQMNGQLMIWANTNPQSINKKTYLDFIHAIYFEHYFEWYKGFLSDKEFKEYEEILNTTYRGIDKEIKTKEIQINGYHSNNTTKVAVPNSDTTEREHVKRTRGLVFLTLLISVCLFLIMKFLDFGISDVIKVFIISFFVIISFLSIYSKSAMKVLGLISKLFKSFFRNIK